MAASRGVGTSQNARDAATFEPSKASRLLFRAARRASDLGLPHLSALTAFTLAADGVRGESHNNSTSSKNNSQGGVADILSPSVASVFIERGRALLSAHLPSFSGINASMESVSNTARQSYRAASVGDSESRHNHIDEPNSMLLIGDSFAASRSGGGSSSSDGVSPAGPTSHGMHGLLSQRLSWRHGVIGLGGRAMLLRALASCVVQLMLLRWRATGVRESYATTASLGSRWNAANAERLPQIQSSRVSQQCAKFV